MGIGPSRRPSRAAQVTVASSNSYKYPPKSENYFSSHFIMGGERFESAKPDAYLFGENEDLNFLGSKPTSYPYPVAQPREPTKTLKSLVNIRRDSVRFVKENDEVLNHSSSHTRYNIEFTFDTDVRCAITIYYFAREEISSKQAVYFPQDPRMNSDTFHYKRGANQTFSQPTHFIDPSLFKEEEWKYNSDTEVIPVVIQCLVEEPENIGHSHMTFAVVEKSLDGGFTLKAIKQKQMVDGLCYLLQEIYGIENKNAQRARQQQQQDDDTEDNGSECVICMCETRDTLILPCRHLCLCNSCADNLRYQANNCPICRAKFHALLQIKAIRRHVAGSITSAPVQSESSEEATLSQDRIPAGYESISLIEALNGPTQPHCACSVPTLPSSDGTVQSLCGTVPNANISEAVQKANGVAKMITVDEVAQLASEEIMLTGSVSSDEEKQNNEEKESNIPHPANDSSKEDRECYDFTIPVSDDDDSEAQTESSYATPLHQSRVMLKTTGASMEHGVADLGSHLELVDEGRLHINASSSDDSRYSSSSSTRDLLEHGAGESTEDSDALGVVGHVEDINISVV